eukprot:PhM_4_TR8333/c0_g1_i1/m.73205
MTSSMNCQELCAAVLQWHCSNAAHSGAGPIKTFFHSCRVPPISINDYVARIFRYAKCSPECMVIALVYIDRFVEASTIPLTLYNVHRMILVAVMIAAKIRDDIYFSNSYYGNIGGIPQDEVNRLEVSFLSTLKWDLWVEPGSYYQYLEASAKKIQQGAGSSSIVSGGAGGVGSSTKEKAPSMNDKGVVA